MECISLFSGIEGIGHGITIAGLTEDFKIIQCVEQNEYRQSVIRKYNPVVTICSDIRSYHPRIDWKYRTGVVFGGSPCQNLSSAGNREGITGDRSILFFEMLRVIEDSQPAFILWENVTGCVNRGLRAVMGAFRVAGYNPEVEIISAQELGASHLRQRVFVTAYSNDLLKKSNGNLPATWSRQVGVDAAYIADSSRYRYISKSIQEDLSGGSKIQKASKVERESRTQPRSRGYDVSRREPDSGRIEYPSGIQGVDDGIPRGIYRDGWWSVNTPSIIHAPTKSVKHRHQRVSALGDSCTPQQAAVCWLRLKYLKDYFQLVTESS